MTEHIYPATDGRTTQCFSTPCPQSAHVYYENLRCDLSQLLGGSWLRDLFVNNMAQTLRSDQNNGAAPTLSYQTMDTTSLSLMYQLRNPQDDVAWERFVRLYTPMLMASVKRLGLQDAEAADVVQDVFLLLQKKLPEFEYDATKRFRSWLQTVTINKCRDHLRSRKRNVHQADSGRLRALADGDNVELFTEEEYRQHLVRQAMAIMKSEFETNTWRACWEHTVAERPASEIAAELGMTPNAVYLAKSRVLRRLREHLAGLLE